ncbi:hypothetical protein J6590_010901 [Homalodisca vitripennis]|nr:hypothetical protein J6590_010901 [Homalodisca vitripennis]
MDDTVSRSTTRHVALSCEGVSQVPGSVLFWERPLTPTLGHLPPSIIHFTLLLNYNLHGECFSVKYSRMDDTVSRSTTRHVALSCEGVSQVPGSVLFWERPLTPTPGHFSSINYTLYSLLTYYNLHGECFSVKYSRMDDTVSRSTTRHVALSCEVKYSRMDDTVSRSTTRHVALSCEGVSQVPGSVLFWERPLTPTLGPSPPSIIHFTLLLTYYNLHGECFSVKYSRMDDTVSRSTTRHVALSCEGVSQVPGSVLFWERPLTPTPGHLPSINYTLYSFVTYYNLHGECFSVKYSRMDDTVSRSTTRHVALSCEGVSQVPGSVLFWERPLTPTPGRLPSINYTLYSFC